VEDVRNVPRPVNPQKVARLQRRYLALMGASPEEIRRYAPILKRQIGAESSFQTNIGSPAGARDIAQFMPATARTYGVTLGDNRIRDDIRGQVRMMLPLFRRHGVEGALRGYNAGEGAIQRSRSFPETNAYVQRILRGGNPGRVPALPGGSSGAPQAQGGGSITTTIPGVRGAAGMPQGSEGLVELLTALEAKPQPRQSAGLMAPAHSAQPVMPQGAMIPQGGGGPAPKGPDVAELLAAIQTSGGGDVVNAPGNEGGTRTSSFGGVPVVGAAPVGGRLRGGRVVVDPNADRPGARTHGYVIRAAQRVSAIAGSPVRIGTGTRHSRLTVNGNVSAHWSGAAADIPATGGRLIRLGQAALIDAGMSPGQARKATGGLYNVGGAQVIFNTHEGGDHTTHLHYQPTRRRRG
jgi:hypothetical protein